MAIDMLVDNANGISVVVGEGLVCISIKVSFEKTS